MTKARWSQSNTKTESGFCTLHSASYQSRHEVSNVSNIKSKKKKKLTCYGM